MLVDSLWPLILKARLRGTESLGEKWGFEALYPVILWNKNSEKILYIRFLLCSALGSWVFWHWTNSVDSILLNL